IGEAHEVEAGKRLGGRFSISSPLASEGAEGRSPAEQHVFRDRHLGRLERHLRNECDASRQLAAAEGLERHAADLDAASERNQAEDRPEQRRLAGPVRADQRHPFPVLDGGRDSPEDGSAAEVDRDRVEHDHGPTIRLVRSTTAKNGAPKNAVTTPMGSSAGASAVRAITSAKTRKPAPTSRESGSTI